MPQYLPLPDGSSVTIREGESPQQAWARAQQMYPDAFGAAPATPEAAPQSGGIAAAKAGYQTLKGDIAALAGRTGLMDEAAAEQYKAEREAEAKKIFKPTEQGWTEAPLTKLAELGGGSLPYMAAPVVAGALAPEGAAALGAAGLASLAQFTGSNLSRQMDEGKKLGETSLGAAAAAAVPQAALDMVGFKMMPSIRGIFGAAGKQIGAKEAELIAKQGTANMLKDYGVNTLKAMGAEGVTEAGQQFLERLQAGLNLTDEEARDEYWQNLIGGAVLGGVIAPAGRYAERSKLQGQQEDEAAKKAQAERTAKAASEKARRETPDYAREVEANYLALEKQREDLKGHLIKIDKESPTLAADRAHNKEIAKQIEELSKNEIAPAAKEYNAVKPVLNQIKEQERLAEQERMQGIEAEAAKAPQEAQQQQYFQSPQVSLPGFENVEQPQRVEEVDQNAKALELAQQHKEMHDLLEDNQQAQSDAIAREDYDALDKAIAHREVLQTELSKVQDMLKETGHPIFQEQEAQRISAKLEKAKADLRKMAGEGLDPAQVVKKRAQIKELEAEMQQYGGVQEGFGKEAYVPMGGKSESRQAFGQRMYKPDRYRLGAEEEEMDVAEQQRLAEEQARADAERERRIAPEVLGLQRIGKKPPMSGNVGEGQISGNVDKLVDALLQSTLPATGRVVSGTTSTRPHEADVLRGQLQYAQITNNRSLEKQIKEQMAKLKIAENEVEGGLDTGLTAKAVGVEGRLSPQAREANRIARIAQSQMATFDRLVDFIQYIRENDQNIPDARKQTLRNAAEKLKDTAIGLALNEAQARRKAAGVAPMTTAEQTKMVGELESIMTELIERGAGMFEPTQIVGRKAQMRANKIVMGATEEERRAPLGRRVFNNFEAAAQALREQMRDAINVEPEATERKPLTPPQRVKTDFRTQFSGQQRDVDAQFDAAYDRSTDEEYKTLRDIRSKFMSLSPEAQDIALEQVRRVETGRGLDMPRQLTDELADLRQARVSDGDQNELFPGTSEKGVTRTTSKRFINFLDSKEVSKLRDEIAEQNRQAEFQAKRAATIAAKVEEEAKKADDFLKKIEEAKNKSPVEKAQAALVKISSEDSQVQIAIKTADAIKRQRTMIRQRISAMVEQVQTARDKAEKQLKDVQDSFDYIAQQYLLKPKNVKFNIGLDYWEKELKKAEKQFESADKALNAAKATQLRVTEDHASDTINNALINEGEKAEREHQRAKDAVLKAQGDEIKAKNALEKARLEVAKEPRSAFVSELLERVPGENAVRRIRDTSDATVQRDVKAMRGIIAKDENAYEIAVETGNMAEAKKIADRIEDHYEKINDILNNAPVKVEARLSAAEAKALREFEDAQIARASAMNAEFRQKAGLPAPKLTKRTVEGVVKTNRGAVRTAIKEPSVAQQEREAKTAPKSTLDKIAETRAEEARLQAQIDYIASNPSPTKEGKAKQRAAKAEAVAQRAAVRAELKELSKEQTAVVRESKEAKKETKSVRTKGKEFVRADTAAAKVQESVYSGEQADFKFSRGVPATGQTVKELKKELERGLGEKLLIGEEEFQGNRRLALHESPEAFMQANPEYAGKIPSDAKGFVDNGKAHLFANNIGEGHALGVLLHEVGVHIGFRNFFNEGQFRGLANAVKSWAKKTDNSIEARVGKAAMARVEAANTEPAHVDDELIAYAVEEAMNMGVRPDGVGPRSVAHNWLKMVVDAFKKALAKFGINPSSLTAGDMVNFAYGCAQIELKGTWHGAGVEFDEFDHAHMGKGEGAQAFGWGTYRAQNKGIARGYKNVATRNTNDRQELEWLENPEVQAWIKQQEPKIKGTTLSALSDFAAEGKEGDVKYGIPHTYAGVFAHGLAHITELNAMGRLAGIDPKRYFRDFVNNLANDMEVQPEMYEHGFEEMYQGDGIAKNVARLYNFMKTFDGLEVPAKKEPPIPEPKPVQGALKRTLHLRPETEYLDFDRQADKQSAYVMDRVANLFDGLDDAQQKAFLRSLAHIPNPSLPRGKDVYNAFSAAYELETPDNPRKADEIASKRLLAAGIAGNKFLDQASRDSFGTHNYVDFADKGEGAAIMGTNLEPVGHLMKGELLFSRTPEYATPEMAAVGELTDKFVAKNKSRTDKLRAAAGGWLGLETQLVDRFAGFERISKTMDALKGSQMMYYLRMYDQRMNFTAQAAENGALKIVEKERADGQKEHVIESTPGASIKGVVQTLNEAKPFVGNGEAVNRLFTMYMSGIRANSKGFDSLNFGEDVSESDLKAAMDAVNGNAALKDVFERAREEYNEYNRDMMEFLASTGAISEQTRKQLTQENDYIPWYRENNGVAELMIGGESRIRIGSIAEQPYLHELVGGDRPILDFMTSSVQNTRMLADMGLRNLATKNAVFELVDMDMAKIVGASTGNNIVKFKVDGKDKYASVETDSAGIPGDLLVKGMEGIPTQMPAALRIMSLPSRLLRKGVTLSPLYAAKQLFRDSLAAPILSGADFMPVAGALKEINKPTKELLERRGIVGGQIFTGTSEDLTKILRDITDGKSGWLNALAKAEAIGMEADALTRRAQYNSYINQGLSEMEATLAALESMNFNKRGASPSIHMIGAMIPFFNAQIQGLNVLYKAMTGNMPFNERLKIQEKMLMRGGMLAAGTLAYAAMMQDDDAYKNATPDQKYGNWFVRIPGVDEPVRIPVPFEVGYIFKALPEALYNSMVDEHGGEEAVKAFKQILLQTIPGGTSYGIPQALKPAIEAGLGKSFYTGRDLLSAHEKSLLPEEQFRANTTEAAKLLGKGLGVSPIILEQLVNGYTGPMGLAFLQAVSLGIPQGNTPEQATKRLSEMPLVGGAFQPNDAGGIINATYDRFEDAIKTKRTVDSMVDSGRMAEAKELLQKSGNEYMAGEMGDYFTTQMKELTQFENAIRAMNITPDEKRARLDKIKALKISLASASRRAVDKIAPQ